MAKFTELAYIIKCIKKATIPNSNTMYHMVMPGGFYYIKNMSVGTISIAVTNVQTTETWGDLDVIDSALTVSPGMVTGPYWFESLYISASTAGSDVIFLVKED